MNVTRYCQLTTQLGLKVREDLGKKAYQDFQRLRMRHAYPESTIRGIILQLNKRVLATKSPSVILLALQAYAQEDFELAADLLNQTKAPTA